VLNLEKLYGGSAEMYWRGAFPGLSIETIPELGANVVLTPEQKQGMKDMMEDYMNGLQRYLSLMGMQAKSLAPQVVDPTPQITVQLDAICIKIACPKRIFVGSERGELASSQDDKQWNDRLAGYQSSYVTPRAIVPFVNRLICVGVLPEPKKFCVKWPDLNSLSDTEKADIALKRAQTIHYYMNSGGEAICSPIDFWTRVMGVPDAEAKSILKNVIGHLGKSHPDSEHPPLPGHPVEPPAPELPPGTPVKMGQGETLVDPDTKKVIHKTANPPKPPAKK
jgi:hypothetical protein